MRRQHSHAFLQHSAARHRTALFLQRSAQTHAEPETLHLRTFVSSKPPPTTARLLASASDTKLKLQSANTGYWLYFHYTPD